MLFVASDEQFENVTAALGQNVTFSAKSDVAVEWRFKKVDLIANARGVRKPFASKFSVAKGGGRYNLTLHIMSLSDLGEYSCAGVDGASIIKRFKLIQGNFQYILLLYKLT